MKRQLLTVAMAIFFAAGSFAEEHLVSPDNYSAVYGTAANGDVLLMETGNYTTRLNLPAEGVTITLKAADGATPVLNWEWRADNAANSGGVIFDGVTIDRMGDDGGFADYFMNITSKDIEEIAFLNCTIQNIDRCLIRSMKTDDTNSTGKIRIENCIVRDCGMDRYNFIYTQLGVKEVTIKNSTFYNYNAGESLFCPYAANPDNVLNFTFENNTVYNWSGATDGRAIARTDAFYSASSTYTFRNNIFDKHAEAFVPNIVNMTDGIVIAQNNLVGDYGTYLLTAETPAVAPVVNDFTLTDLGLTSIGFADPANGDFTIASTSPIATAGVNGVCLGDPRWIEGGVSIPDVVAEPEFVNAYSIDGVMVLQNVTREEAVQKLPRGLYIVGNKKLFITK